MSILNTFLRSQDNSVWKGPLEICHPNLQLKVGSATRSYRRFKTFSRLVLKTSRGGLHEGSLGNPLHCLPVLRGKMFLFKPSMNLSCFKSCPLPLILLPCAAVEILYLPPQWPLRRYGQAAVRPPTAVFSPFHAEEALAHQPLLTEQVLQPLTILVALCWTFPRLLEFFLYWWVQNWRQSMFDLSSASRGG